MKNNCRDTLTLFLRQLREEIIEGFESIENSEAKFQRTLWDHHTGGGGEISLIRGKAFEKAAVNWSAVSGPSLPMKENPSPFFATGVSLITHMKNPHAPTVHMNIRYIETEEGHWFGGGYDLTPMGFSYEEDRKHFHSIAKQATGHYYEEFSQNAKDYFYIPHWKKERGVGGIFFDSFNTGNFEQDYALWKKVGTTFLDAILPIYRQRIDLAYNEEDLIRQAKLRAHYVEFNLLYDRGTKFGFISGGNPNAILCSMPPNASW